MNYSLLQAVSELYYHNNKNEKLIFIIIFHEEEETPREVWIGKLWDKAKTKWTYFIRESFLPPFNYNEENFLANLFQIKGLNNNFNTINYTIKKHN